MKKILLFALALVMTLTAASAETALDAFNALAAGTTNDTFFAAETLLDDVMAEAYVFHQLTDDDAARIAPDLTRLSEITSKDIAAYAADKDYYVGQVRNAYYRALAAALSAEIRVNPASEEKYQNIQLILSLFLKDSDDAESEASRDAIRRNMTRDHARTIASDYNLPTSFVEFIIMDDDWNDDLWDNDKDWIKRVRWDDDFMDRVGSISIGARDEMGRTDIADLQAMLIALGYLNGNPDGVFGPRTEKALLEFQLANGLPGTGIFDEDDYDSIYSDDVVARRDYDDDFYDDDDWDDIDDDDDRR